MSVYVDPILAYGWILRGRSVKSCHLLADTIEELHELAQRIGLKRSWFQGKRHPHYDLVSSKRKLAISFGAVPLDDRESLIEFFRRNRPKRRRIPKRPVKGFSNEDRTNDDHPQ